MISTVYAAYSVKLRLHNEFYLSANSRVLHQNNKLYVNLTNNIFIKQEGGHKLTHRFHPKSNQNNLQDWYEIELLDNEFVMKKGNELKSCTISGDQNIKSICFNNRMVSVDQFGINA